MTQSPDNHIVKLPFWVWILKIVQGALAVIILGLAAYGVHWIPFDAWGMTLFTSLFTGLVILYYFLSTTVLKVGYSWIPVIVLESLAVLFWLVSFAMLADLVGSWGGVGVDFDDDWWKRDLSAVHSFAKRDDSYDPDTYYAILCAGMTFALFSWLLFIVTLIMLGLAVHRHRMAGGPIRYGGPATNPHSTTRGDAERGAEKYEVQNIPPPAAGTAPPAATVPDAQPSYYQQPPPQHQHQPPVSYEGSPQSSAPSPYPPPSQPALYQQSVSPPPPNTYEAPAQ